MAVMPTRADGKRVLVAARLDWDAQPLTTHQPEAMVPFQALRGRPKLQNPKQLLSVRYSIDVIEYFRATGEGWQARMDEVMYSIVRINVTAKWEFTVAIFR